MQLTKGMYGSQFYPKEGLFGIRCGQMRSREFVHNGGWYNKRGEKIGWGDLSKEDIQRISDKIDNSELFIILSEQDSFWNFVTEIGIIGSMSRTRPDIEAPGTDYVTEHAQYIISKGKKFYITNMEESTEGETTYDGITFNTINREKAEELINHYKEERKES